MSDGIPQRGQYPTPDREVSMPPVTYQTIKLDRGKHRSPQEGACVMELASMLAGEPFSDEPASVCPVIGSFLRAYNDSIDDERRQDLYAYASKVVGSRGSRHVQRARAERLTAAGLQLSRRRRTPSFVPRWLHPLGRVPSLDSIGAYVVHSLPKHCDATHRRVLALIDELLAMGTVERGVPAELRDGSSTSRRSVSLSSG
jgi:hypothetical protein